MIPPEICGYVPRRFGRIDPRWLALKDETEVGLRYRSDIVHAADRWVNHAIRYQADSADEWAKPSDTLARRCGDCEDMALLKRAILLNSGIGEDHICFVLVHDVIAKRDHALLVVLDGGQWKVLDSRNSLTMPVERLADYRPIMALSGGQCWTFGKRPEATADGH